MYFISAIFLGSPSIPCFSLVLSSSSGQVIIKGSFESYSRLERQSWQQLCPQMRERGGLDQLYSWWQREQAISKSIASVINYNLQKYSRTISSFLIISSYTMKILRSKVLYISKQIINLDSSNTKLYPFLNFPSLTSMAHHQIVTTGIHALCNLDNIKNYYPTDSQGHEFVFFGRSNAGKSSLLNKLIRRNFVQTSKKPGKTKQLIFLNIKFPTKALLVDAPGYGYASAASKYEIKDWGKLIEYYLKNTTQDKQTILLLSDLSHGLKEVDGMLINMLSKYKKNFMLIFTKCDKATDRQYEQGVKVATLLQEKYPNMGYYVHFTSSKTQQGILELRNHLLYQLSSDIIHRQQ